MIRERFVYLPMSECVRTRFNLNTLKFEQFENQYAATPEWHTVSPTEELLDAFEDALRTLITSKED